MRVYRHVPGQEADQHSLAGVDFDFFGEPVEGAGEDDACDVELRVREEEEVHDACAHGVAPEEERDAAVDAFGHALHVGEELAEGALAAAASAAAVAAQVHREDRVAFGGEGLGHAEEAACVLAESVDHADLRLGLGVLAVDPLQQQRHLRGWSTAATVRVDQRALDDDAAVPARAESEEVSWSQPGYCRGR